MSETKTTGEAPGSGSDSHFPVSEVVNVEKNNEKNLKFLNNNNNNSIKYSKSDKLKKKAKDLTSSVVTVTTGIKSDRIIDIPPVVNVDQEGGQKNKLWKYRGFLYTLISSIVFSLTALLVKFLKNYNPINIALWRFQGALFPAIPLIFYYKFFNSKRNQVKLETQIPQNENKSQEPVSKRQKIKVGALLLTRSILSCNALLLHFYSLQYLELGDALVISSSTPVFAYFFAHYILDEPCGIVPVITSFSTLLGVIIIIKPPHLTGKEDFDFNTLVGGGLALGCTLLATISYVLLRYLRRVHYSITMAVFGSWGTVENLVLALFFGVFTFPQGTQDWLLATALATLTFFGQMAIILALQCEQTGPVSLIRTTDIIFGFCLQIIFSQIVPDVYSLVGSAIVISGVVLTGYRKWLASLPANHSTRTKFWFILK